METTSLDDLMALNDQLSALVDAGIPLDLGLGKPGKDTAATLEKINAAVARRVSRGATLTEALEGDDQAVPAAYRAMVQFGLRVGNLYAGLDDSHRLAESAEKSRYGVRSALFYPLVVCCLALAGMVGFCLFFVPTLQDMHSSLGIQPGSGLQVLESLRDALPYWIAIPPIALLLVIVWQFRIMSKRVLTDAQSTGLLGRLPGMSPALFQQRCAIFADTLATLLAADVPLEEGLRIAARACGDAGLSEGAQALAAALKQGHVPSDDSPAVRRFPPFLRWALLHSEPTPGRTSALQMAANIYRESAEWRSERLRLVAPILACVIVGGGATLLYGLALFVPVVEMLKALA